MNEKQYKALITDVDGTLVPTRKYILPTTRVIKKVQEAARKIHVGIATGRSIAGVTLLFEQLHFSSPCILNGGAEIRDPQSQKILWQQSMRASDVVTICRLAKELRLPFVLTEDGKDIAYTPGFIPKNTLDVWILAIPPETADRFIEKISYLATIAINKVVSPDVGKIEVFITHASATKQQAIAKVAKLLHIFTNDIIGIGDGYNDFPLLMACGLKVAMGNAVEELKEIADYVAPPLEEDGVADVIEKFVLHNS